MSYSLKNKAVVVIALAFSVMVITSRISHAQAAPADAQLTESAAPAISEDMDIFGLDDENETEPATNAELESVASESTSSDAAQNGAATAEEANLKADDTTPAGEINDDFLNDVAEEGGLSVSTTESAENVADDNDLLGDKGPLDTDIDTPQPTPNNNIVSEVIPTTEAPKSPFENFGNSILSKVDNDLFNQMSSIEKQTTILNLELKREELKNRVEALKAARVRAQEEEAERRREAEEKRKEREAERQAKIIAEQEKLKQREIELEKVRQARVLNEYMNEMLIINQQWVEKNAALQTKIHDLEKERIALIKDFEKKSNDVYREISSVKKRAENAVSSHERVVTSLNAQITQLRKSVIENEDRYKKLKEGNNANPFATMQGLNGIDENAIDMSKEYAIMDITGKGENIIAKIVNSEGTTFIVHKGSMLKGGEVVTAITDNYIAFDNRGVKSYLYTGGTVMEFEPTVSFNDSEKMPEETIKASIKTDVHNILGQASTKAAPTPTPTATTTITNTPTTSGNSSNGASTKRSKRGGVSASSGMFSR